MVKINKLKSKLAKMFQMKDLGVIKKILGIKIQIDGKNGKLCGYHNKTIWRIY
jgi:hypothetical protein